MIEEWLNQSAAKTAEQLLDISSGATDEGGLSGYGMKNKVQKLIHLLRCAMYPKIYYTELLRPEVVRSVVTGKLQEAAALLYELCCTVMSAACSDTEKGGSCCDGCSKKAGSVTCAFMDSLCRIAEVLNTDIIAAYEGDPAAKSTEEILLAYPAFEAISIYRMAHRLYELGIPMLPRMMTEHAHQLTGIDIHPGATIGRYFFIDHGTGVVIGETTTIGDHVKLYQGVTLGAKSFELDENGNPVKGIKRHPDLGSRVVVYAGATILGGNTRIGDDCVIGGNVWLTHSVESGKTVVAAEERALKIF